MSGFARAPIARAVVLATLAAAALVAPAARAGGWQEMHETSDDVRFEIGEDGAATVLHHLRVRVVAGHFLSVEIAGVDPAAVLAPEAAVVVEKSGLPIAARAERSDKASSTVRVVIDEPKGLTRGAYLVDVKYTLDLVATKALTRDGAMWKVTWTAPPAPEGHDGARIVFDVPAAPTEPRLAAAADSTTTLPTLRRGAAPGRDELELVRAHVPRGEAVVWAARIDPKAFPRVSTPDLRPPPPREIEPPSPLATNLSKIVAAGVLVVLAFGLALVLRRKQHVVALAAASREALARPLVKLPGGDALRPALYGVVTVLGLASLAGFEPKIGAALVAFAMALAAHRAPAPIAKPRAPGAWKPLAERVLLPSPPSPLPTDAFDIGAPRGRITLAAIVATVGLASVLLRTFVPEIALALPLAATALLPLFLTGTRAQMIPSRTESGARLLRPSRDALAAAVDLSHVDVSVIGRVIEATGAVDELRLACIPRDRTPGLRSIELAIAACPSGAATPEILVRFDRDSAAADRMSRIGSSLDLGPGGTSVPTLRGRTPDEVVARLAPEEESPRAVAALVGHLVLELEGRRASDRNAPAAGLRWTGRERRIRPMPAMALAPSPA